jgi:hypothetical protein
MSETTWKKEFYPVEATSVRKAQALNHSIRKWRGLMPDQKKKHKVSRRARAFAGITIDAKSCALCEVNQATLNEPCHGCELYEVRGNVRCDKLRMDEQEPPWEMWDSYNDPSPMLAWLLLAKELKKGRS